MRICEIVDMNVVAYARAVGRQVVGAMNLQSRPIRVCRGEREWNQMGFRMVQFADFSAGIGSASVEIPQPYRSQSVSAAVSLERTFEKKLGNAIGIDRFTT